MTRPRVAVLDYGCGKHPLGPAALGAGRRDAEITADWDTALNADGLVVPGVGAFAACMAGLREVRGDQIIDRRLAGSARCWASVSACRSCSTKAWSTACTPRAAASGPASCSGFTRRCCRTWAGTPSGPPAVTAAGRPDPGTRFYFVHSYAALALPMPPSEWMTAPLLSWAEHGEPFVAAVENGPLCATQFHPEKSGDAGAALLANWLEMVR